MRRFLHWYGASPLHLLTMLGCFALAGYAAAELLPVNPVGILLWFAAAVIGHDLILMPLYTLADRSVIAIFRRRPLTLPAGPWINYLRVPAMLSGLLLLIWFPLIFRLPSRFPASTTLPLDPYLWHWLAVTGALFLLSATALALRLGAAHRRARNGPAPSPEAAGPPAEGPPDPPVQPEPPDQPSQTPADATTPGPKAPPLKDVTPPAFPDPATEVAAREPAGPDAEVPASIAPTGIAPAGTILPDAGLLDVNGTPMTLYAATGSGPSVLAFYRGDRRPDGTIAWPADQERLLPQLIERGITLVAISPQQPDGSLAMPQQHELAFTVVSDPGNSIAGRLGLLTEPSGETVARPMPATVILDPSHTVRWIDVHPDDSTRTESDQVIAALEHLEHPEGDD